MSKIKKEISCIVGTYTNKDGQSKNRYQRIGSIIETKNGEMLKIDSIPMKEGGWDGWAYINDPRPTEERPKSRGFDDFQSDAPF
jgi:hypothetical protein